MRVLVDTQIFIFGHAHSEAAAVDLLELLADQTRFEIVFPQNFKTRLFVWVGESVEKIGLGR